VIRALIPTLIVIISMAVLLGGAQVISNARAKRRRLEDLHQLKLEREKEKDRRDLDGYLDERLEGD
jgi:hypothetical protein